MTPKEAANKWNISRRRIQQLCSEERIDGAKKIGEAWVIPYNACKPLDARSHAVQKPLRSPEKVYTSIDLFSGPGGLCTGFKWGGIKPLIAVEWSHWTVQTYAASHDADILELDEFLATEKDNEEEYFTPSDKTLIIHGDINKVSNELIKKILLERFNVDTVDIVSGGAPCESFSMAGERKEDDERNHLYKNILRIAQGVNSKMLLFENVKGLLSKRKKGEHGKMYKKICDEFEKKTKGEPSYKLASRNPDEVLLLAADYGVPQLRERLFLVGINSNYSTAGFTYPEKTHGEGKKHPHLTVEEAIMDLPQISSGIEKNIYDYDMHSTQNEGRKEFLNRMRGQWSMVPEHIPFHTDSLFNHKAPGHTDKMKKRMNSIRQGENMKSASERLIKAGKRAFVEENFPKRMYAARNRRLVGNLPSFTVTSHCLDEMIHPHLNRGLSPREAARLQSFPDWYQIQGPYVMFHGDPEQDQYEQIGDAIPPILAFVLANEIRNTLNTITEPLD